MSKIAVALPYAVSIRDFVHSGALAALLAGGRHQVLIYTLNPELPELAEARGQGVAVHAMLPYQDNRPERWLKRLYPLFFADRFAYIGQSLEQRPLHRGLASLCVLLRRALGTSALLGSASRLLLALYRRRHLPRQLAPGTDLLVGTRSLINSLDYGLMAEASAHGTPVLTVAGSWDNFTTKGYFPFPVLCTVVWNEKMRQELMDLFSVPAQRIVVAGYPRAALLRNMVDPDDAAAYLRSLGINGYRRYVLYSASYSELTRVPGHAIPLEYQAIQAVCRRLTPTLPADTCVLIRLHPFSKQDDQRCFDGLAHCHVFVPGRQDQYVERVMGHADERHLAQQIGHAECVVSMASTMTIDTLCLAKPILNIAFDPVADLPRLSSIRRFYEYNHFRDLVQLARLPLAQTDDEVLAFVAQCLAGRYRSPVDHDAFRRMYVPDISDQYPQRIRATIDEVIAA